MSLQHTAVPPHLHLRNPTPNVDWKKVAIDVPTELTRWETQPGRPRRAGVSSFGASGTNAHVVIEEWTGPRPESGNVDRAAHVLCLSAKSEPALKELAGRYEHMLATLEPAALPDICFTAATGRVHFRQRLALVGSTPKIMQDALGAYRRGEPSTGIVVSTASPQTPKVAFLFSGQGAQYAGMGRELYNTQPTFRGLLDQCAELLRPRLDRPLLEVIFEENDTDSLVNQTAYTQPALFALEYALARLWMTWGVKPTILLGHSVGEYVAACIAGVLELDDALKLIAARGRLMGALPAGGGMVAVLAAKSRVEEAISKFPKLSIAAINGPGNVVVSGESKPMDALIRLLDKQGIETRPLQVSHAFHSPLMEPVLDELEAIAGQVQASTQQIPIVSNLTGQLVHSDEMCRATYWRRHAREGVQFAAGMQALENQDIDIFLEVGPRPVLLGMGQFCLPDHTGPWLPSLRPEIGDCQQFLESLANLYVAGVDVDWRAFDADYGRRSVILPTYPFARTRHWFEAPQIAPASHEITRTASDVEPHPLLGYRVLSPLQTVQYESRLRPETISWLKQHCLVGMPVLPAAGFIEMALVAARSLTGASVEIEDVFIEAPLTLQRDEEIAIQFVIEPDGANRKFRILSLRPGGANDGGDWAVHVSGRICSDDIRNQTRSSRVVDIEKIAEFCATEVDLKSMYKAVSKTGIELGPAFQTVNRLRRGEHESIGWLKTPAEAVTAGQAYLFHPTLVDGWLQVAHEALPPAARGTEQTPIVPMSLDRLRVDTVPQGAVVIHAVSRALTNKAESPSYAVDVEIVDETGKLLVELKGLRFARVSRDTLLSARQASFEDWLCEVRWQPAARDSASIGQIPVNDFIASPVELADVLAADARRLSSDNGLAQHDELLNRIESLSTDYVLHAFEKLGWHIETGQRTSVDEFMTQFGIQDRHRRLLGRMMGMLEEDEILKKSGDSWEVCRSPVIEDPAETLVQLVARYPAGNAELTMVDRFGSRIAELLRGECDPLELMFPSGSLELAEKLYRDSPMFRAHNELIRESIKTALTDLPAGRTIRILEIGAGTGGTTSLVLPDLPADQTDYTFTDVSPLFIAKAQERFAEFPFVNYRTLDIERSPIEQGFTPNSFDLIIAPNVLHATADLRRTLRNVLQLLAPGGLFVLLEGTRPQRYGDLMVGFLEGWWMFSDTDIRPSYALITAERWLQLLDELGFCESAIVTDSNISSTVWSQQAVILSRGPDAADAVSGAMETFVVFENSDDGLVDTLRATGANVVTVTPGANYVAIDERQFTISPEQPEDFQRLLRELPLSENGMCNHFIYRWAMDDPLATDATLNALTERQQIGCGGLLHLAQVVADTPPEQQSKLWVTTRGALPIGAANAPLDVAQSSLWGLARVIAVEHPEIWGGILDSDPTSDDVRDLVTEFLAPVDEDQIGFRGGNRYVARLVPLNRDAAVAVESMDLIVESAGTLDGLVFAPGTRRSPGPGEVEIKVIAIGLTFRDVLKALDMYPGDDGPVGVECAGTIASVGAGVDGLQIGDPVIAVAVGSFCAYVTTPADLVALQPEQLTCENAAGIPSAFMTAWHALHTLGRIKSGERVLIHSAAGGVGLAAVQIARAAGAEVFATAGSPAKRDYLTTLGVEHVMDSRSLEFADEISEITDGEGVDLVLNSLIGDSIHKSLSLLGQNGRFLEIGRRQLLDKPQVVAYGRDLEYHVINLADYSQRDPVAFGQLLRDLVQKFSDGTLQPLRTEVFPFNEAPAAFHHMAQAKHIGKIVIARQSRATSVDFDSDASYLITGGLGGLGLCVAKWMVARGARNLVLMGRSAPTDATRAVITELEAAGAIVHVQRGDVSQSEDVIRALEVSARLGPLRGVIHSAGVVSDGVLLKQNWQRFVDVMRPKVDGAWNLHTLTAGLTLDFFVIFSSAVSVLGTMAQGNHAAACAFQDALANHRRAIGLPGLSINWGPWSEIGAAVDLKVSDRLDEVGINSMTPDEGLQVLEQLMAFNPSQVAVLPMNWQKFFRSRPADTERPYFVEFKGRASDLFDATAAVEPDLLMQLGETPLPQQRKVLVEYVRAQVCHVLRLGASFQLDPLQGLRDLGIDSLMSVELKNRLQNGAGCTLPQTLVFDYPTLAALVDYLAARLIGSVELAAQDQAVDEDLGNNAADQHAALDTDDDLVDLSSDAAEALLLQELSNKEGTQ